jgi:hypothetical protein
VKPSGDDRHNVESSKGLICTPVVIGAGAIGG